MLDKLSGVRKADMQIIMSGRNIGKSTMAQMWNMVDTAPAHIIVSTATVDGAQWYTIRCNNEVAAWVREQPGEDSQWYRHIDAKWHIHASLFDVHEEFYMMLKLRWGC